MNAAFLLAMDGDDYRVTEIFVDVDGGVRSFRMNYEGNAEEFDAEVDSAQEAADQFSGMYNQVVVKSVASLEVAKTVLGKGAKALSMTEA